MDYRPDRSFVNELKRTDKRLGCRFNGQFFVVTYQRPQGDSVPIMSIRGEDGRFRQPDNRDVIKLKESDLAREDYREKFLRRSKMSEAIRDEKIKRMKRKEYFRDVTKDNKIQLRNAFGKAANIGKSNSTFRRIESKPKGKVF